MKYKVGDRVRVKSLDWYNKNKNKFEKVWCANGHIPFDKDMCKYCGKVMTISHVRADHYTMVEDLVHYWTDEMIEGLVEEETKPITYEDTVEIIETMQGIGDSWECPQGYQFVDENGNVINAQKIVLEKKKKEYPKTYEECCKVMNYCCNPVATKTTHKEELIRRFQFLLLYRDAYWKLYGEENGLGKPWEPSDSDYITGRYCIFVHQGNIICSTPAEDCPFTFPTEEMRDAFKRNFDPDLEFCKELL